MIIKIYLSRTKDSDLIALLGQVGMKCMRASIRCCLRSLLDPNQAEQARTLIHNAIGTNQGYQWTETDDHIGVSFTNQEDEPIRAMLNHLQPRKKSGFLKQLIRFTLGPAIIMPLYFQDNFLNFTQTYAQFLIANPSDVKTKPKRRRRTIIKTVIVEKDATDHTSASTVTQTPVTPVTNTTQSYEEESLIDDIPLIKEDYHTSEPTDATVTTSNDDEDDVLSMLNNLLG